MLRVLNILGIILILLSGLGVCTVIGGVVGPIVGVYSISIGILGLVIYIITEYRLLVSV